MRPAPHTPQAARLPAYADSFGGRAASQLVRRSLGEGGAERSPVPAQAGIGLRFPHQRLVAEQRPAAPWFEVHTENYFGGGTRLASIERIREHYPLSLHGTALSLGSAGGIDAAHLKRVAECAARLQPGLISEHLSFSRVDGIYYADLLPLPLTEEALTIVCRNVDTMQDALKRRVLIENPSTYLQFRHSAIPEWEFLAALAARTGCGILCDVNNIYVSACNHGWDALAYVSGLPPDAIGEIHLAGHAECMIGGVKVLIDNHGSRVAEPVWDLFDAALRRFGPKPVLIEWDTDIPEFSVLQEEAARAELGLCRIPAGANAGAA
ncbi:MAG: DUF692 domain-containing protein [Alphaproteobacteria bacterium]|nr:DUF692 domain-containing protein [Alphaproteobacteria bacterium]